MKLSSLSRLRMILFLCIIAVLHLNLFQPAVGEEAPGVSNNQASIRVFQINNPKIDKVKEKINQM